MIKNHRKVAVNTGDNNQDHYKENPFAFLIPSSKEEFEDGSIKNKGNDNNNNID